MGEHMSPAQARELAEELRHYREILGMPAYELADRLGWSASKLSRVEHGLSPISEVDVVRYGAHCGVSAEGIEALLDLCRDPGAAGYWLSKWSSTLVFAENTAAFSASYDPLVVPGMLQTQEYAAALIGQDKAEWVQVRMERQRLLNNRPFEFFIHEQALRLPVGGDRVMNEQLLKLVLVAAQPTVTIRVVPSALGAQSMFGGAFLFFRYDNHQPLVYVESGFFLDDEQHIAKYQGKLAGLSKVALSSGESREVLAEMASEVDRPEESPDAPDDVAKERLQF
ncbi:helix-turn-helix domain-containing protein [Actinophytocola glycyrrhizae]|uniref:Helix-turn-helix domain-containing protein n=1 Tax=Actinophytocola glycyrrhizae TaxID=2044873 RepID=A0ABV9S8E9_9PSEU